MALSPMMQQYLKTKEEYKDCILFYRLGDFYEMFFDDALIASKELEITLTGKDCGLEERAPMCGVPHHAVDSYLSRLVAKGYKVAIGEQVEDPKQAKGIVKREVIKVVTPGTNTFTASLDETKNNYLMSVFYVDDKFGISTVDITTGDFYVTEVDEARSLIDEINKFSPSEIICNNLLNFSDVDINDLKERLNICVFFVDDWYYNDEACVNVIKKHFQVSDLTCLGLMDMKIGATAAGSILNYLYDTQKNSLQNLTKIIPYQTGKFMIIDTSTRRNLELCETLREKQKRGSLLWVLDKTKTAMGARMLRSYIEQPLINPGEILKRQNAIEELNKDLISRDELREYLNPIYDLERLLGKIAYKSANPRDLIAFGNSISMLPHIRYILKDYSSDLLCEIYNNLDELTDIAKLIEDAIIEDPPINIKEGGIIKESYNSEIERLRKAKTDGKKWLLELEEKERNETGIKGLKIKYNKNFGYCIEITNSYKDMVPPDRYVRRQTLTNAERYVTEELKNLEETILGAEDKLFSLEYGIFTDIRDQIAAQTERILNSAKLIAKIDVFSSLAFVAERNNFVKPKINDKGIIQIKGGRHPVVEQMLNNDMFVENDTYLDNSQNRISIITGPNMAGKSTYMRQTALIVLMAQIGSFVPAKSANIGICDRIFTRVGASDDLASGQSTFMVEMTEVANILRNATKNSLLILDEIGRGTSTFDGLSIAWAVIEHIANQKLLGAKTLFATHYHELTELEGTIKGVNNYCIAVREKDDNIIFLRKIIKGGADKSYGIQVAKLAGVPQTVIDRAKELVEELSNADINIKARNIANNLPEELRNNSEYYSNNLELGQMSLFETVKDDNIIDEIKEIDIAKLTPIDALNVLYKLQNKIINRYDNNNLE